MATVTWGEAAAPGGPGDAASRSQAAFRCHPTQIRLQDWEPGPTGSLPHWGQRARLLHSRPRHSPKGHLSSRFRRSHTVLQPELLTKTPKTCSCHQAFFVEHFLQSDKEGANTFASQHEDLQPQQACPTLSPTPCCWASGEPRRHREIGSHSPSQPGSGQQSPNSLSVPWRGTAAEASTACSTEDTPVGRHRSLHLHGSIPVGGQTHSLGQVVPALACPWQPEQGAPPPRVPQPQPAAGTPQAGSTQVPTTALPTQAWSCWTPVGSCRLSALPRHH